MDDYENICVITIFEEDFNSLIELLEIGLIHAKESLKGDDREAKLMLFRRGINEFKNSVERTPENKFIYTNCPQCDGVVKMVPIKWKCPQCSGVQRLCQHGILFGEDRSENPIDLKEHGYK